jgi:hypothetical protein
VISAFTGAGLLSAADAKPAASIGNVPTTP